MFCCLDGNLEGFLCASISTSFRACSTGTLLRVTKVTHFINITKYFKIFAPGYCTPNILKYFKIFDWWEMKLGVVTSISHDVILPVSVGFMLSLYHVC